MDKLNIIYKIQYGSDAFGTTTNDSDNDLRGIYLPSLREHIAIKNHKTINLITDMYDLVYHPLKKYVGLAMKCNPSAIEWLFVPEDKILSITGAGSLLRRNRKIFLNKECYFRFKGFATSEWRRAIGENRQRMGFERKRQVEKYGYDLKSAMNTIRLLQQCQELLTIEKITMPRPNAKFLKDIKLGKVHFDIVKKEYEVALIKLDEAYNASKLPEKNDINKINELLIDIVIKFG